MASSTSSSWLGFPVMDVFNIMYLGLDEVVPEKQLGTIKLHCSGGIQYLYQVEDVDIHRPSIKYGDCIPITVKGPSVPFYDYIYIEFDLFCGAYKGKKRLQWDPIPHEASVKSLFFTSNDGTGQVLVHFGAYANAAVASVEVKLSTSSNVCGVVLASNSELELDHCASVLFMEKSSGLMVGEDDIIPLSRSFVGVPLHSELYVEASLSFDGHLLTGFVSFDPEKEGLCEKFLTNDNEEKISVKVVWVDIADFDTRKGLIHRMYDQDSISQRNATPLSVDKSVEEEVSLEFDLLVDQIEKVIAKDPASPLSGISRPTLSMVISYSKIHFHPSTAGTDFDLQYFKQLDIDHLFNLIQAANQLQNKSLMNLTCRTLVNKVKTKISEDIMEELNVDNAYIRSVNRLKRSYSEEDIPHSEEDIRVSILRQHEKETFINKSLLVDVPISPLATERPRLYKQNLYFRRCFSIFMESDDSKHREPVKFREASRWLNDLVNGDAGLADCLSTEAVECLLGILAEIDNSKDRKDLVAIQSLAVRILSRALSHNMFHKYSRGTIPAFVKLMSNPLTDLSVAGVMALARLAYACPNCRQVILENGALEKAQEIAKKIRNASLPELRQWLAKFLAIICYRYLPDPKVKVALMISEDLLTQDLISYRHIVSTCYALQYLTYKQMVAIQGEAWDKLIRKLIGLIIDSFRIDCTMVACSPPVLFGSTVIASSALGVVGNIARWGNSNQIQTLANDSQLLQCLGMMLRFKFKKFTKEACQIISNIAARRQSWIQNMHEANLIEPLYDLLEKDMYEPDVKMEAAWAIFNGIYGDEHRGIDQYPNSEFQLYCPEIMIC